MTATAEADILLTSTFAWYGEDMLHGRVDPHKVQPEWHISVNDIHVDTALAGVLHAAGSPPIANRLEKLAGQVSRP